MTRLIRAPGSASRRPAWLACLATVASLGSPPAGAQGQHDGFVFLSVESFDNLSDPVSSIDNSFVRPAADILYAYNNARFRFLGEYIWSSTEAEMERFEVGWRATDRTMFWVGRFHTIAKYWTTEYHHGQFMQTSISRPGVEEWEDESGPMPSHLTGLSIEHEIIRADQSAVNLGLAVGYGPTFAGQELEPFDLFDPQSGHDLAVNVRAAWRPDALSDNEVGILIGWNDIPVDSASEPALADLHRIEQLTAGVFLNWQWPRWRVITSWTFFKNDLGFVDGLERDDFVAGYLQGELRAARDWTVFGRTEASFGEDSSIYLSLLPAFVAHRNMLGLRWDFVDQQSLTVEVADTSAKSTGPEHDNFKELRLQWSAVFP